MKKRMLSLMLMLCVVLSFVPTTAFASENQITNNGGKTTQDEVAVNKTVSKTGTENMFDITLRVESTKEASKFINQPPMAVAIVLDVSATMFQNNRYYPAREAMKEFITRYCADSVGAYTPRELSIITFNTNAKVMYPLSDCKDKSPASIMNSVDSGMKPIIDDVMAYNSSEERFTNMEAGLKLADNVLSNSKADNKYILLFTDGVPSTYISREEADFNSTDSIKGYCPISSSGNVGADGVFYNVPTSKYCNAGTNYSDKGALYAVNQAKAIKDKNIKIYSVGIQIDTQTPVEDMKKDTIDYDGVGDYVINTSTEQLFDSSVWNYKYKNWLYSEIGSGCYYDGNNFEQLTNVCSDIYSKITADSRTSMVTKLADSWKVSDLMNSDSSNKNIEFLSFYDKNGEFTNSLIGSAGNNNENTASFDASNDTITWDLLNSGDRTEIIDGFNKYVYELKYRVRLKNEKEGFLSNTFLPANGETTLKYVSFENEVATDKTINFPIPEVKGYLANLEFTKVDGLNDDIGGTPLSGAKFKLMHSDSCHQCIEIGKHIDIAEKSVNANAAGQVSFSDIPSGHCYDLIETVAPEGYILPENPYSVEVNEGKIFIDGIPAGETLGNEPRKFKLDYVIIGTDKPVIDKTDATPPTKTDIPYNRDEILAPALTTTDNKKDGEPGTWTFSGWYDNAECIGNPVSKEKIKQNETMYGKWTFTNSLFKVNFDSNGGSSVESKMNVNWSDKVLDNVVDPTYNNDGYEFIGWTFKDTFVTKNTRYSDLVDPNTLSITLKAQWKSTNTWAKSVLRLQATASKTSVKLKWNKIPGADGYVIYWNKCGARTPFKQMKVIKSGKSLTWVHKNLKKSSQNRYTVKAYKMIDGKRSFIKKSNQVHIAAIGGKYTNVTRLKSNVSSLTLKKGKTKTLKIKQTFADNSKKPAIHMRPLTYTSSNKKVATVTSKGVIKAKGKGRCYIYITAYSGVYTRVKVTVK